MTADEARLILNVKREDGMDAILKVRSSLLSLYFSIPCPSFDKKLILKTGLQRYEHLFKVNSPPPPPEKPVSGKPRPQYWSHYLQSKVVRAKERLEAEMKTATSEAEAATKDAGEAAQKTGNEAPPPPSQ